MSIQKINFLPVENFKMIIFTILCVTISACNNEGFKVRVSNTTNTDSAKVSEVIKDFHNSIEEGNKKLASNLLANNATILEFGIIESKKEYFEDHFYWDGEFKKSMNRNVRFENINISDDFAWVTIEADLWGTYNSKTQNLSSLESFVLKCNNEDWKILSIHWSSMEN